MSPETCLSSAAFKEVRGPGVWESDGMCSFHLLNDLLSASVFGSLIEC
jgi:hypothetical protein